MESTPDGAQPAVEVRHATREYPTASGAVTALASASLTVRTGEAVALIGPSGSGKTTFLNLVAGLDRPTSGSVWVLGQMISSLPDERQATFRAKNLGLVFQDPHLLPGLTALENVALPRLPWESMRQAIPRARSLLAQVGLAHRLGHAPAALSAGERQRVGIARALMGDPPLLLADEPTGNLDAASTAEVVELILRLRQLRSLTFIVVTHDLGVTAIADRVASILDIQERRPIEAPAGSIG